MALDPTCGPLSDPTPASGSDLQTLSTRAAHPPGAVTRQAWETRYARSVVASDAIAVAVVCATGALVGARAADSMLTGAIGLMVAVTAMVATYLVGAWDSAVLGSDSTEYRRVVRGFAATSGVLGLTGLAARMDEIRPWVFGILPLACLLAVVGRFALRKALHRRRAAGQCRHPVLAVGSAEAVADLIIRTRHDRHLGWTVTGACTPTGTGTILGVPVVGDLDAVAATARRGRHRIVSVCPAPGWTAVRLDRLAWDIDAVNTELVVDPSLTEVAGPRLRTEPVNGLDLLRLTHPTLSGGSRLVKALIDRAGAALLLVLLAPVLVVLVVAIRSGGGPVFHREIRVGRDGKPFTLRRFRSSVTDPEPHITAFGSWMRHYSLDELPQLFNVLGGSMSLVGPRPSLSQELEARRADCCCRPPVKPGLTGLWHVGGHSVRSPEEGARLDLRYVQNWSLTQDAAILAKAIGTVGRHTAV